MKKDRRGEKKTIGQAKGYSKTERQEEKAKIKQ
jgi:hypothetical protein